MSKENKSSGNLQDTFEENSERYTDIEYRHPQAEHIEKEIRSLLSEIETGKHLLQHAKNHNLEIYLIRHKEIRGHSPEGKIICLSIPEEKSEIEPRMVLELVAGLREAEQTHLGYTSPRAGMDPLEFAALSHAKNLDIVVHMCRVAFELHKHLNTQDYVDVLEKLGHGGIYDAYVRDFSSDKIVDTYYAQGSQ